MSGMEQLWQCQDIFSKISDGIYLLEGQLWLMTLQLEKKKKSSWIEARF